MHYLFRYLKCKFWKEKKHSYDFFFHKLVFTEFVPLTLCSHYSRSARVFYLLSDMQTLRLPKQN